MAIDSIVFPGQGAQRLGMGQDFKEHYPAAAAAFAEARAALPFDPDEISQTDEAKLNQTAYTQPCIVATEIAMLRVLETRPDFRPTVFAGHSLGEYSALVAAKVIPFEVALKIVHQRGTLMQTAVPPGMGTMAAVLYDAIPQAEFKAIAEQYHVDLANDNSANQVVLSGKIEDVKATAAALEAAFQPIRIVYLEVSAPFHSRYMQPIEAPFREYLESFKSDFSPANLPRVVSNYTGTFYKPSVEALIDGLTKQLSVNCFCVALGSSP